MVLRAEGYRFAFCQDCGLFCRCVDMAAFTPNAAVVVSMFLHVARGLPSHMRPPCRVAELEAFRRIPSQRYPRHVGPCSQCKAIRDYRARGIPVLPALAERSAPGTTCPLRSASRWLPPLSPTATGAAKFSARHGGDESESDTPIAPETSSRRQVWEVRSSRCTSRSEQPVGFCGDKNESDMPSEDDNTGGECECECGQCAQVSGPQLHLLRVLPLR